APTAPGEGLSREDVDRYSPTSQERAAKAWTNGYFTKSIVPVVDRNGVVLLDRDEHMRPDSTMAGLGELRPSFAAMGEAGGFDAVGLPKYHRGGKIDHVHTPGNSSRIAGGAPPVLGGSEQVGAGPGATPPAPTPARAP